MTQEAAESRDEAAPQLSVPPTSARLWRDRLIFAAGLVSLLYLFAYRIRQFWEFTLDDAFITLREARNLADGHGFVYNIGWPPVESYTSHLLFLFQALVMEVRSDPIVATKILGSVSALVTILAAIALARDLLRWSGEDTTRLSPLPLLAGPFVITTCPILPVAAVGGLETDLFAALVTLATWRTLALAVEGPRRGDVWFTGLLLGLATWARPEGIAWVAGLTLIAFVIRFRQRTLFKPLVIACAIGFLFFAALLVFRLWEFGRMNPNTYYAKMGTPIRMRFFNGLRYSREWAAQNGGFVLMGLGLVGVFLQRPARRTASLAALVLAAGQLLIVIYEGGDWMPHLRMIAPLLGVLAAVASIGVALPLLRLPPRIRYGVSILVPVAFALAVHTGMHRELRRALEEAQTRLYGWTDAHRPLGQWLAGWYLERQARGETPLTVAITDVGNVGWLSDVRIIDLAGLADPEWAGMIYRSRGTAPYPTNKLLTRQEPEVIVLVSQSRPQGNLLDVRWFTDREIYSDPEFHRRYVPVAVYVHKDFPGDGYFLNVFVRKDVLSEAPPSHPPRPRSIAPEYDSDPYYRNWAGSYANSEPFGQMDSRR